MGARMDNFELNEVTEAELETKYDNYVKSIEADYNWEVILQYCEDNYANAAKEYGQEEIDDWGEFSMSAKSTFLGTVFALCPSGKYYTPWANSNVDYDEAILDACWYDAMDEVFEKHGFYVSSGEGSSTDLFAVVIA